MQEITDFLFDSGRRMAEQAEKAEFYRDMDREMETPEWKEAHDKWQAEKDLCE